MHITFQKKTSSIVCVTETIKGSFTCFNFLKLRIYLSRNVFRIFKYLFGRNNKHLKKINRNNPNLGTGKIRERIEITYKDTGSNTRNLGSSFAAIILPGGGESLALLVT